MMTDREIITLAKIREALGVGHKHMLTELIAVCREIRRDAERYRKLRQLTKKEFSTLFRKNFSEQEFDAFFDAME